MVTLLHLRLIDPVNPKVVKDPNTCPNVDHVVEELVSICGKGSKYSDAYSSVRKRLQEVVSETLRRPYEMFELANVEEHDL